MGNSNLDVQAGEKKSYSRIMRSSSLIGGAEGFNLLLGMVRVKFVALFLGPSGLGLMGIFQTIKDMVATLSGLGISSSGVRDVADAVGSGDSERIARTALTLRRMCWITGIVGAGALAVLAKPISSLTFQSDDYAMQIALLGAAVLLGSVSAGQMTLIQGMRRIGDLARLKVITSVAGTLIAIIYYWRFGVAGIVPGILTLAAVNLAGSIWFSRRIQVEMVRISWRESFFAAKGLVTLGLAFMWTVLLAAVVDYATRALITHEISLAAVGVFAAAFRLSGMFVNFVLGAMGADYFPALTAVSNDHTKMREMVNQQTEIGMLLAVPGLLATIALAPWIIQVFYTGEFVQSSALLQWFVLGCLGRVIGWPMGFVVLAKGSSGVFAFTQTFAHTLHLGLIWLGLNWIGIEGVAIAFPLLYCIHNVLVLGIVRHMIGFYWSPAVWKLFATMLPFVALTFLLGRYAPLLPATAIGSITTLFVGLYCLRGLCTRLGSSHRLVLLISKLPFLQNIVTSISPAS